MRSEHVEALRAYIDNLGRLSSVLSKTIVLLFSILPVVLTHNLIREAQSIEYAITQTTLYALLIVLVCRKTRDAFLHIYCHDKYVTPELLVQEVVKQLQAAPCAEEDRLRSTLLIHQQWRSLDTAPSVWLSYGHRLMTGGLMLALFVAPLVRPFAASAHRVPFGDPATPWSSYVVIGLIYVIAMRITWVTTVVTTRTQRDAWEKESDRSILYTPPYQLLDRTLPTSRVDQLWIRITGNGSISLFNERPTTTRVFGAIRKGHLRIVRTNTGDSDSP